MQIFMLITQDIFDFLNLSTQGAGFTVIDHAISYCLQQKPHFLENLRGSRWVR